MFNFVDLFVFVIKLALLMLVVIIGQVLQFIYKLLLQVETFSMSSSCLQ